MSPRTTRRLVWLALLFVVPLPMLLFGAWIPVARYLLLGGACIAMVLAEGSGGLVWQLTALFLGHALVYAGLLWVAAWLLLRALAGLSPGARNALVAAGVVGALVWATLATPFVTPFGTSARTNLVGVLR